MTAALVLESGILPVPLLPRTLLCAVITAALCVGALERSLPAYEPDGGLFDRARRALREGARCAWPAAAPLALLPFARIASHSFRPLAVLALGALAAALLAWRTRDVRPRVRRPFDKLGLWESSILLFAGCIGAFYVFRGARAPGNWDNDSAYYFGVARHIVRTGRWEEPIVWHFLAPPAEVLHPPFDYWGGVTSLVLLPAMAVFGPDQGPALVTMAVVSALSVLCFAYLVTIALPLRSAAVQLLAVVLFAFSPWLAISRFDTESLPVFHLVLLLSLIALARRRYALAMGAAFLLPLTRAEGIVPCGLLWMATAVAAWRAPTARWDGRLASVACAAAVFIVAYVLWCLSSFGAPIPPGLRGAMGIKSYSDLYAHGAPVTPPASLLSRLDGDLAAQRAWTALGALRAVPLVPAQGLWLFLGLLPGVPLLARRPPVVITTWLLFYLGLFLVFWWAPPIFNPQRTMGAQLPLVVLVGALGLSEGVAWFERSGAATAWPTARRVAACVLLVALCGTMLPPITPYTSWPARNESIDAELRRMDTLLAGEPVITTTPWQVMSITRSPAISVPEDGERAIEDVVRRYRARWLVLTPGGHRWMRRSRQPLDEIIAGHRRNLGALDLEPVHAHGPVQVFRIVPARHPPD